jgi:hypothetical protein
MHRRADYWPAPLSRLVVVVVAAVAAMVDPATGLAAPADPIPTVTVESSRETEQLKHDVDVFVSSAITKSFEDSLMRWNEPICPLIAGLNRPMAEFMLLRVSNLARAVHAPLDGEQCRPNLYVLVAQDPGAFLKLLWRHKPNMFDTRHGIEPVKRFIETPRPVRVWYNASEMGSDNSAASTITSILAQSAGVGAATASYPVFSQPSTLGSRLTHAVVRDLSDVIVVIDAKQIDKLNIGQLADYVGMISLAQIDLDKSLGVAPSILKVFNPDEAGVPLEITEWDRALLTALYSTSQKSRLQISQMQTAVFKELAAQPSPHAQPAQSAEPAQPAQAAH